MKTTKKMLPKKRMRREKVGGEERPGIPSCGACFNCLWERKSLWETSVMLCSLVEFTLKYHKTSFHDSLYAGRTQTQKTSGWFLSCLRLSFPDLFSLPLFLLFILHKNICLSNDINLYSLNQSVNLVCELHNDSWSWFIQENESLDDEDQDDAFSFFKPLA